MHHLLSLAVCSLLALGLVAADNTWESYKIKHGKSYNLAEDSFRKRIYDKSHAEIVAHNQLYDAGQETYKKGHTKFSDLTDEERVAHLGFRPNTTGQRSRTVTFENAYGRALHPSYDLRKSNCMPAIKNQRNCGDCWAFATTTPIEYQYCIKYNQTITLSEQQLTDCTYPTFYDGCNGGDHHDAWSYLYNAGGQEPSSDYPFKSGTSGMDATCKFRKHKVIAKLANTGNNIAQNEVSMQSALVAHGPLTFAYYVSSNFFQYKSGIFSDSRCKSNYASLNHEMVIVGYGVRGTTPYWIVRNQWGIGWGLSGYALIKRGSNMCGIAVEAGYPTVL